MQENSNDDELAGLTVWLPDIDERDAGREPRDRSRAGVRRANTTAAVISSVAITQDTQRAAVRVEGAGKLDVHAVRMQNPERLVLDFTGARLSVQKTNIPGVSAPVRGVRLGQFRPDVARVVIDLTASAPYQITHDGDAVVVYVQVQPAEANEPTAVASTKPVKTTKQVAATATAPQANAPSDKTNDAQAAHFPLPNELTQPSAILATTNSTSEPAHAETSAQQAAQQAMQQAATAASTVAAQQAAQSSTASPTPSSGKYTGEPISVNLKDVDLKDFFRLIHEISGLNVVLDPNVKGTLTIVLDEVPWDQALDIVLQSTTASTSS